MESTFTRWRRTALVYALYSADKWFVLLAAVSFVASLRVPRATVVLWGLGHIWYLPSFTGAPSLTGRRAIESSNRGCWLFDEVTRYFRFSIVREGLSFNSDANYVFGYHPHGVIPCTSLWMSWTSEWLRKLPGIHPTTLVSSILHYIPGYRDWVQCLNGGVISRRGIQTGLSRCGSVILIPGGQREMLDATSGPGPIVLNTRHRGFVREAMIKAASTDRPTYLCPIFGFGENQVYDNLTVPRWLQELSISILRVNVFFFPYGRWGIPGMPRPVKLTVVIGEPILVPEVRCPTTEEVDVLYRLYLTRLRSLYERHRKTLGSGRSVLFEPDFNPINDHEFKSVWQRARSDTSPGNALRKISECPDDNELAEKSILALFFLIADAWLVWRALR